jgi:hypothetical protein
MNVHENGRGEAEIDDTETTPLIQFDKPLSKKQERRARIQFLALCWSLFVLGWTDGSVGPLLPRIQQVYDVSPSLKGIGESDLIVVRLDMRRFHGFLCWDAL